MVSHGGGSDHAGPGLVQALALLLQSEHELPATSATNLVARFSGRSIQELCAMGGITSTTSPRAWPTASRRCGPLSAQQESRIRSLHLERLEALAEALLDFEGMADLNAWLAANA